MKRAILLAVTLMLTTGAAVPRYPQKDFDIQAHRGGLGLRVENTLASFGNALRLGVTTLELDVQITADGQAVVTHDRRINPAKCEGAFAGQYIKDLTLAQVRTMDCGSKTVVPGRLKVIPYTVNDPATIERVIKLGVDGIISDHPETVITVARRFGLR